MDAVIYVTLHPGQYAVVVAGGGTERGAFRISVRCSVNPCDNAASYNRFAARQVRRAVCYIPLSSGLTRAVCEGQYRGWYRYVDRHCIARSVNGAEITVDDRARCAAVGGTLVLLTAEPSLNYFYQLALSEGCEASWSRQNITIYEHLEFHALVACGNGNIDSLRAAVCGGFRFNPCADPASYDPSATAHSDCDIPLSTGVTRAVCEQTYAGHFIVTEGARNRCIARSVNGVPIADDDDAGCAAIDGTLRRQQIGPIVAYYHNMVATEGCEATLDGRDDTFLDVLGHLAQRYCGAGNVVDLSALCGVTPPPPIPLSEFTIDGGTIGVYSDAECTVSIGVDTAFDQGGTCTSYFPVGSSPLWDDISLFAGMQCTPTGNILACYGLSQNACEAVAANPAASQDTAGCTGAADYSRHREGCYPEESSSGEVVYLKWDCANADPTPSSDPCHVARCGAGHGALCPQTRTASNSHVNAEHHGVRCCSDQAPQFIQDSHWAHADGCPYCESDTMAVGFTECQTNVSFAAAEAWCAGVGARICSSAELAQGCCRDTGCGLNSWLVWTSDVSQCPAFAGSPLPTTAPNPAPTIARPTVAPSLAPTESLIVTTTATTTTTTTTTMTTTTVTSTTILPTPQSDFADATAEKSTSYTKILAVGGTVVLIIIIIGTAVYFVNQQKPSEGPGRARSAHIRATGATRANPAFRTHARPAHEHQSHNPADNIYALIGPGSASTFGTSDNDTLYASIPGEHDDGSSKYATYSPAPSRSDAQQQVEHTFYDLASAAADCSKEQVEHTFYDLASTAADVVGKEHLGARVTVEGYDCPGTLRFFGEHAKTGLPRCGVELDRPLGKNNGKVKGNVYFSCKEQHGVLVAPGKVTVQELEPESDSDFDLPVPDSWVPASAQTAAGRKLPSQQPSATQIYQLASRSLPTAHLLEYDSASSELDAIEV